MNAMFSTVTSADKTEIILIFHYILCYQLHIYLFIPYFIVYVIFN